MPGETAAKGEVREVARSEADIRAIQAQTAEAIKDAEEKNRGSVPAGLVRWADEVIAPPKVDWRVKLSRITRNAAAFRPGAVDFKYDRPSRRQSAVGHGIGCPRLPALKRPCPNVAIAVDTSGSMSQNELAEAVSEADGILKSVGATVDFIACDADVGEIRKVSSARELAQNLVGGGGTSFVPAIEAATKLKPRPEILVYATDGYGPAPDTSPRGMHIIWLLPGRNAAVPYGEGGGGEVDYGDVVRIDYEDEEAA
jgi:predicted metal-dependent peptidase